MDTERSFDNVLAELKRAAKAGVYPLPNNLVLEAVEAQAQYVRGKTRDFTFPTLNEVDIFIQGDRKEHTLAELPITQRPNVRGFFEKVGELTVMPTYRGGPVSEDALSEDVLPGRVVLAGYAPPYPPPHNYLPYLVYEVSFEQGKDSKVSLMGVKRAGAYESAGALIGVWPAITPTFLLEVMAEGFGRIADRHEDLAKRAHGIYGSMFGQLSGLVTLLNLRPKNTDCAYADSGYTSG